MGSEILDALTMIAKEKGVDPDYVLESLEKGLLSAAQRKYRRAAHVEVQIDQVSGRIAVIVHKRVAKVAWDLTAEIDLEEARKIDPSVREGDVVPVEIPVEEFGRNAISIVKQSILQRVKEAERKSVYEEYSAKIGQIVTGTVQLVERGRITVKLGKAEGLIPASENIRRDRPKIGEHIRALVVDVDPSSKGPQVILSRTRPEFVIRLFEQEVPEVYEGIVEIKAIAREPGVRTKVAVVSHDEKVDPVGACVGVKGSRVQNIVKALGGERIDIVAMSADPRIFVSRALSPAKVLSVSFMDDPNVMRAVVPDDELSTAIGKNAQNVRLAGQLMGIEIQIVSQSQQASLEGQDEAEKIELESLAKQLGPKLVEKLIRAGKETLQDVLATPAEELMGIPGIGEKTASKLITVGARILEEWTKMKEQEASESAGESDAAGESSDRDTQGAEPEEGSEPEGSDADSTADSQQGPAETAAAGSEPEAGETEGKRAAEVSDGLGVTLPAEEDEGSGEVSGDGPGGDGSGNAEPGQGSSSLAG